MAVYLDKSRRNKKNWRAEFVVKGVKKRLGRFESYEEARRALDIAKGIRPLFK